MSTFKELIDRMGAGSITDVATGCRLWKGAPVKGGYGQIYYNQKRWYVHRLLWTVIHGDVPAHLEVCHKCHNPLCINPNHLFLGTHQENMSSSKLAGRCGNKLTLTQVEHIRKLSQHKPPHINRKTFDRYLGEQFGVSGSTIQHIRTGHTWRNVCSA